MLIIVSPTGDSTNRGPTYDGRVDGRQIVHRSTQPFLDGARALLAEGADPDTSYVMRHAASDVDALTSTVGYAAKWTIAEGDRVPHRVHHVPYDAKIHAPERPPVRSSEAGLLMAGSQRDAVQARQPP
jgi:hypothetical protein